jgi:hypothetical protein
VPSTVVHLGVAAVLAAALLADDLTPRRAGVVLAAAAVPDIDTFVGLVVTGAHRALLHTALFPLLLAALLVVDVRRTRVVRSRYGRAGVRTAWVAVATVAVAGVAPDLLTNGVNVLYPIHDEFISVNGRLVLSNQRGVVQTFVDLSPDRVVRNTSNTAYFTGVDPQPRNLGAETQQNVERVFPVVGSGLQLLLIGLGFGTLAARLAEERGQ